MEFVPFRHELATLSDAELFYLQETIPGHTISAHRHEPDELIAIETTLGIRDFATYSRIVLIKAHRLIDAKKFPRAQALLDKYLNHYESYFSRLNPDHFNRFAISFYRLLGDIHYEHNRHHGDAANYYFRIMGLRSLRRTPPFSLVVAGSRIVRGAVILFGATGHGGHLQHLQYGLRLYHLGLRDAVDSRKDFIELVCEDRPYLMPKTHFFIEIARESAIVSDSIKLLHRVCGTTGETSTATLPVSWKPRDQREFLEE